MSTDSLNKIERLFHEALKQKPEERNAFLTEHSNGDPSIIAEVESLLAVHKDTPALPGKAAWMDFLKTSKRRYSHDDLKPDPDLPFERLGDYKLIRRLGQGGMGIVYLAIQEPLSRPVALKIIRPERKGSFEIESRFLREAEAISKLNHPGIITVYGSGEEQGVQFYAMELLKGVGLNELLRNSASQTERLPLNKIVDWIKQIAHALATAHEAGIIHRDIKPSNIHITPEGRAILMDFGIARDMDLSTLTLTGEFRGTPQYASPEQIRAGRESIDARTDIYSLAVTFYEAVTGRVPFQGETTEQVFRLILEEEPVSPRRMNPYIPLQVDTIISKAMEKDIDRRYQSMSALSEDLGRYQKGIPIRAKQAGMINKGRKVVKKHPTICTALLLGIISILYLLWSYPQILSERNEANRQRAAARLAQTRSANEAKKVNTILDFLLMTFQSPDPSKDGMEIKVVDVLDKAVKGINSSFDEDPEIRASLQDAIAKTYRAIGLPGKAKPLFKAALETRRKIFGEDNTDTQTSMHNLALVYNDLGMNNEAESLYRKVILLRLASVGEEAPTTLKSMTNLGLVLRDLNKLSEAEEYLSKVFHIRSRLLSEEEPDMLMAMHNLALLYATVQRFDDAEKLIQKAAKLRARVLGEDKLDTLASKSILACVYENLGKTDEAESLYREIIATQERTLTKEHSYTLSTMNNFAKLLMNQKKYNESESIMREVVQFNVQLFGDGHPDTLQSKTNLASMLMRLDKLDEANALFEQVYKEVEHGTGDTDSAAINFYLWYGEFLKIRREYCKAEQSYLTAYEYIKKEPKLRIHEEHAAISLLVKLYEQWGQTEKLEEYQSHLKSLSDKTN